MAQKRPSGSYLANISLRHTVADGAGNAVWAFRNPVAAKKSLYVRKIRLLVGFDGAAAVATSVAYELIRFTGADPTTGTTVPRIKKKGTHSASALADANIQQKSGALVLSGANIESGPFHVIRVPASVTGVVTRDELHFDAPGGDPVGFIDGLLVFRPGDGLAIRTHLAAIIGLNLSGSVEWDEVEVP